ncbi:hypothetical protein GTR02_03735 [Kineococcus sp. R8]|uniref:hypothetical protein n=1 Tax=Kineococcus siccus TaxID=2696567 RepID=UPI00141361E8|nr:hypothetical protein [Kineococcus siccus]NAZ80925.1 hypothetical protein [Kineococcus siccus]
MEIASWEIEGGAPRPVVAQPLDGYRVVFVPADPEDYWDRAALDEDVDLDALPPQVIIPAGAGRGVQHGHLRAEWHVTPDEGPLYAAEPLAGTTVRTRIIACERRLGVQDREREQLWLPVPGSLRLRDVSGSDWTFDDEALLAQALLAQACPPVLGDVRHGLDEGVLVDLQMGE